MCELFGMSSSRPFAAELPLEQFRLRGGFAADNPDGWGFAWWEAGAPHLVKEPLPAHRSSLFAELCRKARSSLIIAHVRKANYPPVNTHDNTHPFQRSCCGKSWIFAHNGLVPDVVKMEQANSRAICQPSGETDSEYAFCHLLSHLATHFSQHAEASDAAASFAILAATSELIAAHGKFNFLMSDGEYLIAYGHDRLHYMERNDSSTHLAMIATEPLSGEAWIPFENGELRIYRAGLITRRILTRLPN